MYVDPTIIDPSAAAPSGKEDPVESSAEQQGKVSANERSLLLQEITNQFTTIQKSTDDRPGGKKNRRGHSNPKQAVATPDQGEDSRPVFTSATRPSSESSPPKKRNVKEVSFKVPSETSAASPKRSRLSAGLPSPLSTSASPQLTQQDLEKAARMLVFELGFRARLSALEDSFKQVYATPGTSNQRQKTSVTHTDHSNESPQKFFRVSDSISPAAECRPALLPVEDDPAATDKILTEQLGSSEGNDPNEQQQTTTSERKEEKEDSSVTFAGDEEQEPGLKHTPAAAPSPSAYSSFEKSDFLLDSRLFLAQDLQVLIADRQEKLESDIERQRQRDTMMLSSTSVSTLATSSRSSLSSSSMSRSGSTSIQPPTTSLERNYEFLQQKKKPLPRGHLNHPAPAPDLEGLLAWCVDLDFEELGRLASSCPNL